MQKAVPATILVVDDEPLLVELLSTALTTFGYRVLSASTGESALASLEEENVDLALIDYHLPGVNGAEVYRRVSLRQPKVRAILMSGDFRRDPADVSGALLPAFERLLPKPFHLEELRSLVAREVGPGSAAE